MANLVYAQRRLPLHRALLGRVHRREVNPTLPFRTIDEVCTVGLAWMAGAARLIGRDKTEVVQARTRFRA
jgi:hypothetical protein